METNAGILVPVIRAGSVDASPHAPEGSKPTRTTEETLGLLLESAMGLEGDPELLILLRPGSDSNHEQNSERLRELVDSRADPERIQLITEDHLARFRTHAGGSDTADLLDLIRADNLPSLLNFGLLLAAVRGYRSLGLVREQTEFIQGDYMVRAQELLNPEPNDAGQEIKALCGLYQEELFEGAIPPWMAYWNRLVLLRSQVKKLRVDEGEPRPASFVLPGTLVVHRDLYQRVPFDPLCPRGPELDWFVNARLFGYRFYMDPRLRIRSWGSAVRGPRWKWLRRDARRYVFLRRKVRQMEEKLDIPPRYLDPWPGRYLKDDLEDRVFRTNLMLSQQYMAEDLPEQSRHCLRTIYHIQHEYDPGDPLDRIQAVQNRWQRLMIWVKENRDSLHRAVFKPSS